MQAAALISLAVSISASAVSAFRIFSSFPDAVMHDLSRSRKRNLELRYIFKIAMRSIASAILVSLCGGKERATFCKKYRRDPRELFNESFIAKAVVHTFENEP